MYNNISHHKDDWLKRIMMHDPRFNALSLIVIAFTSIYIVFLSACLFAYMKQHLSAFFSLSIGSYIFLIIGYMIRGTSGFKITATLFGPFFFYLALLIGLLMAVNSMAVNPELHHVCRHMKILLILSTLTMAFCSGRFLGIQRDYVHASEKTVE